MEFLLISNSYQTLNMQCYFIFLLNILNLIKRFSGSCFGKQNRQCGINRKKNKKGKYKTNQETLKDVHLLRQQLGGHGSRHPLEKV